MSQVRLYLDEDAMRKALVFGLRARNVDAPVDGSRIGELSARFDIVLGFTPAA